MTDIDLSVNIGGVVWKNPVTTASGTFGSGKEFLEFIDLNRLGAVTVKGVSAQPWKGNPSPRIAEVYGGMLNAVGLQNPGANYFIRNDLPFLKEFDTKIVVNICGHTIEEYCEAAEIISDCPVDLLEMNISCPNVKEGGIAFGTDPVLVKKAVAAVKKRAKTPLIVKLSPNVTDIVEIAKAAVSGGADALSMINTLLGMKIDIHKRKPALANIMGGLSGPAVKPVAVRMVYQVHKAVDVPIIGMGGISSAEDAIEFIMAGASAIAVGSASFQNPLLAEEVVAGIENFMRKNEIHSLSEICGIID